MNSSIVIISNRVGTDSSGPDYLDFDTIYQHKNTFEENEIKDGDKIVLILATGGQLFVKNLIGKTLTFDFLFSEPTVELFNRICKKEGIEIENSRLIIAGK